MTTETQKPSPKFILHVGPGLSRHANFAEQGWAGTMASLDKLVRDKAQSLAGTANTEVMLAPETLCDETRAAEKVMAALWRTLQSQNDEVLSVLTYSSHLTSIVINAVIDVGQEHLFKVCLYREEPETDFTVHGIDTEGFLEDWPYGALHGSVEKHYLKKLGFTVRRDY